MEETHRAGWMPSLYNEEIYAFSIYWLSSRSIEMFTNTDVIVDVFTNSEALWTPSLRGFYGGFLTQAEMIKSLVMGA